MLRLGRNGCGVWRWVMAPENRVLCPYCGAHIPDEAFTPWAAQTFFVTAACPGCSSTVTLPTRPDGTVDAAAHALGNAPHGETRGERESERLASRPAGTL